MSEEEISNSQERNNNDNIGSTRRVNKGIDGEDTYKTRRNQAVTKQDAQEVVTSNSKKHQR